MPDLVTFLSAATSMAQCSHLLHRISDPKLVGFILFSGKKCAYVCLWVEGAVGFV